MNNIIFFIFLFIIIYIFKLIYILFESFGLVGFIVIIFLIGLIALVIYIIKGNHDQTVIPESNHSNKENYNQNLKNEMEGRIQQNHRTDWNMPGFSTKEQQLIVNDGYGALSRT